MLLQIFITCQPSRGGGEEGEGGGDNNSEPKAVLPVSLGLMK